MKQEHLEKANKIVQDMKALNHAFKTLQGLDGEVAMSITGSKWNEAFSINVPLKVAEVRLMIDSHIVGLRQDADKIGLEL